MAQPVRGLKAENAIRLKELETEDARLKRLLADAELEKDAPREIATPLRGRASEPSAPA
ncbi:hypothetical protein GCM10025762_13870 [Haloechinothrix salitolerans]